MPEIPATPVALLDRLAHPALVRGFGGVLDGERPHLLLEHVEGPTLERLLRRHGPLPLEQLLPLALHVVAALQFMAAERIAHLDVKPGNIVMSAPPRLIDLSIARSFEDAAPLRSGPPPTSGLSGRRCTRRSRARCRSRARAARGARPTLPPGSRSSSASRRLSPRASRRRSGTWSGAPWRAIPRRDRLPARSRRRSSRSWRGCRSVG